MRDDILYYIADNIPELVPTTNLFANYYPDDPDNIVSVISIGGFPPDKYDTSREPTYEIKFRNANYNDGMDIGNQIVDLFHSKENYQIGSFFILHSYALSEISYLYTDSNHRDQFSFELAFLIK